MKHCSPLSFKKDDNFACSGLKEFSGKIQLMFLYSSNFLVRVVAYIWSHDILINKI